MPYPIHTLPYPFKKRLRQLLTPVELHELQKATGPLETNHFLMPIQKNRKCECLIFRKMVDNKILLDTIPTFEKRNFSDVVEAPYLSLKNFDEKAISIHFFNFVQFQKVRILELHLDITTVPFVIAMAQKRMQLTHLNIYFATEASESQLRLPVFFKAFPAVLHFSFMLYAYKGWVKDILDCKMFGLEQLTIMSTNFDKLFSFCPEEVYQLVKSQHYKFKLELLHLTEKDFSVEIHRTLPLFKPYFKNVCATSDYDVLLRVLPSFQNGTPSAPSMNLSFEQYFKLRPSIQCGISQMFFKLTKHELLK
uniref:F-box/FBD/LRR-repeat protein n=1 Tax=Panagrellus redivivus TaxID=6233 RepID=A0A7E4V061_PANRE